MLNYLYRSFPYEIPAYRIMNGKSCVIGLIGLLSRRSEKNLATTLVCGCKNDIHQGAFQHKLPVSKVLDLHRVRAVSYTHLTLPTTPYV